MHKGQILALEIQDLAFGGKGIAKIKLPNTDHIPHATYYTIFIDGALPGQSVEAKIRRKKRRYAEAKLIKVLKPADNEVLTDYQSIPGAPWANLPVAIQREHKQKQVFELFQKFADLDISKIFDTYIQSPQLWHYRNKMEYSFGPTDELQNEAGEWEHTGFGLGSKKRGQFWLVENLEKDSGLFDADFESNLSKIRDWSQQQNDSVYNSRTNEGFWRSLMVRKSVHADKFLINMITNVGADNISPLHKKFTDMLIDLFGDRLKGVFWTQSDDLGNPASKYQTRELIYGEPVLTESINGLKFTISIDSFFQTNVYSAEHLYTKAVSYLHDEATHIFDLFCGTGTIGQIVASQRPGAQITGVEIIESAVRDAQSNADKNGLKNTRFIAADINKWIKANTPGADTSVIIDPPRAGISPKVLTRIAEAGPNQIIYVSCNPATMARDTALLIEHGYALQKISLVDQFPHTSHVECVGSYTKNHQNAPK